MSLPYNYVRCYKILNPTDVYTHIIISAEFYTGGQYGLQHKMVDKMHRDAYFKLSNQSYGSCFIRQLDPEIYTMCDPSGFIFHIYAIKKSAPEYGHCVYDESKSYYSRYTYLPLGSENKDNAFKLKPTISRFDMRILIAETPRFTVKVMRQIENQFSNLLNSLLPVDSNRNVSLLAGFQINLDTYEEYMTANCY